MSGRFAVICILALAASLGIVAAASAEHPGWLLPGKPGITGLAQVGATLKGEAGPIFCQPETPCTGATAEWLSCTGSSSGGADRPRGAHNDPNQKASGCEVRVPENAPSTYVVRPEDAGRHIQYHVIAHNMDCGEVQSNGNQECNPSSGHGYSPTVGPIAAAPAPAPAPTPAPVPVAALPLNTAPPTVSGDAEDMQTLTANPGTWSGTGPIAYKYEWLHCSTALKGCQAIEGQSGSTYKVVRADIGTRITVTVSAVNGAGSRSFTAKLTERVAAAKPRPGHDVLKISELLPVHRLVVKGVEGARVVGPAGLPLRVTVTDRRGFLIQGATVEASTESAAVLPVEKLTGARGVALLRIKLGSVVDASRVVLTITASKPGENTLTATKKIVLRLAPA